MILVAAGNSFVQAYLQSDWVGKGIFWALFALSAVSWTVLLHKLWLFWQMRHLSEEFSGLFSEREPLGLQFSRPIKGRWLEVPHPLFEIYKAYKQKALTLINRNHLFAPGKETSLSEADLTLLESQVYVAISSQMKKVEKNLFILPTVVTLAPFLGLLGTVWGILLTFSQLHAKGISMGNADMLSGLSLALATTVAGLVIVIPALVGYSYLKNAAKEYRRDMEDFSHLLLSSLELQYRRPDHAPKTAPLS